MILAPTLLARTGPVLAGPWAVASVRAREKTLPPDHPLWGEPVCHGGKALDMALADG